MTSNSMTTTKSPRPTKRSGMGTMLCADGAAFRVWAPFAEAVFVSGTFNNWSTTAAPLASEGNGYWSGDVAGVRIDDHYKFIIRNDGQILWRVNPYASQVNHSNGNGVVHDPNFAWADSQYSMPPWNELVLYELHTGTFNDAPGDGPGTFASVIDKLPYLRDLGINAIEIMPVSEYPTSFSWGYNPSQPFAVENSLGGPQGLFTLVEAAHAQGIAVILDVVYNHFGPTDLDLWRFDGWAGPDHDGGIYFYDTNQVQTPWGHTRPDYGRGEVRQFLRDNALFWLGKYRIDGLRFDSVNNIRNRCGQDNDPYNDLPDGWSLLQWINNEVHTFQPGGKIVIAEDLKQNPWITRDTGSGGAGFDSQWDAGFVHPVRQAVIVANDDWRDMYAVRDALCRKENGDACKRVIYSESHDEVANGKSRLPEEIWPANAQSWYSRKRSTLAAALVFTAPGIPMLFQGQEFLEYGYFQDSVPLHWHLATTHAGILALYRDLIRLRRNWHDTTRGLRGQHINVHHVNNTEKLIAYHRFENGGPCDDVVVVANFANRAYDSYALGFPRGGQWQVRLNSDGADYSPDYGNHPGYTVWATASACDGLHYRGDVGIGPYSVLILSQDRP